MSLHRHAIELLTEGQFTTVSVYFETEASDTARGAWASKDNAAKSNFPFIANSLPSRSYIYKCSNEMAASLQPGAMVIVPVEGGRFKVGNVWQIHKSAEIDFDAKFAYKWVVQAVDTSEYDNHMAQERAFKVALVEAEKAQQREAIRASILNSIPPNTEGYKLFEQALQAIQVTLPAPVQPPTPAAAHTFGPPVIKTAK